MVTKYNEINESYKETLVFGVGLEAGFYSEINNMILAVVYCLDNNIKFCLHSESANFKFLRGWTDYFEPFCDEKNNWFTNRFDHRFPTDTVLYKKYILQLIKHIFGIDFLTYDLFSKIHSSENESKLYVIPELKIDGGIQHACKKIINKPGTIYKIGKFIT